VGSGGVLSEAADFRGWPINTGFDLSQHLASDSDFIRLLVFHMYIVIPPRLWIWSWSMGLDRPHRESVLTLPRSYPETFTGILLMKTRTHLGWCHPQRNGFLSNRQRLREQLWKCRPSTARHATFGGLHELTTVVFVTTASRQQTTIVFGLIIALVAGTTATSLGFLR